MPARVFVLAVSFLVAGCQPSPDKKAEQTGLPRQGTPDSGKQAERKKLIDEYIRDKLFLKVELQQGIPHLWVSKGFDILDHKGAPGIKFVVSYGYSVAFGPTRCCCR